MTHRKAPACTAIASGFRALLLLLPGAFCGSALAATGADTRCDQAAGPPQLPVATVGNLTIEVVEHNASRRLAPGQFAVDGSLNDGGSGLEADPARPQVDALLRRIFDETQHRSPGRSDAEEYDAQRAPLANDGTDTHDAQVSESTDAEIEPTTAPRLPGVFDDHMVRFKRQMYRTDI